MSIKFDWSKPVTLEPVVRIKPEMGFHLTFRDGRIADAYVYAGMYRGFEVFMRYKPAPDVIMLSSRECGICGEHHQYIERIALEEAMGGYAPPLLGLATIGMANDAAMMYDHTAHLTALGGPDWSSLFFKTEGYFPEIYELAQKTPLQKVAQYSKGVPAVTELKVADTVIRTVADIMDAYVPLVGAAYREGLDAATKLHEAEVIYYLRIPHPITMVPGGIGVPATIENLQSYLVRLIAGTAWIKKQVVLWEYLTLFLNDYDNVFGVQAFYDKRKVELGFAEVGRRLANVQGYGGSDSTEDIAAGVEGGKAAPYDGTYENSDKWGVARIVKPGQVVQRKPNSKPELITNSFIDITLSFREFIDSSFYEDWVNNPQTPKEVAGIETDPKGNKVSQFHPWRKWTIPKPEPRVFKPGSKYSWATSPRFVPYRGERPVENVFYALESDPLGLAYAQALQPQGVIPVYRHRTPLGLEIKYDSNEISFEFTLPRTDVIIPGVGAGLPDELRGEVTLKWISPWTLSKGKSPVNAIERMRARAYMVALETLGAWSEWYEATQLIKKGHRDVSRGHPSEWRYVPNSKTGMAIGCGFKDAPRGAQSHFEVVDPATGRAVNPQQVQPTTKNAGPRVLSEYYDEGVGGKIRPAYTEGTGVYEETAMGHPSLGMPGTPKIASLPLEAWDALEVAASIRAFDPCYVCGTHIYIEGIGRTIEHILGAPIDHSLQIERALLRLGLL
jgi:hydrogenase large subunit